MPSFLSGYTKRKKITISNTNVISDLSNFPLMVKVTSDSDIGGVARSDGYDIRFTSSDGTTLLDYEREIFSITSGSATGIFWVCIPTIASAASTDIYIYFGKADATDVSTISFWDSDYSNIYHFGEAGSGLNDSSNYGNHLTNNGLTISGGKANNDGTGNAIASFNSTFSHLTTRSLSALAKSTGGTGRRAIIAFSMHQNDFEPLLGHRYDGDDDNLSFEVGKAGISSIGMDTDVSITSSDIYHIMTVYKDSGEVDFYVNGIYKNSLTYNVYITGQHEIQHLAFSAVPDTGQFKLDVASGNMGYADGASELEGLISGTNVTGNYTDGFDVEFTSYNNIDTMVLDTNSLAVFGSVSVVINQEGDGSNNESQSITVNSGTGEFTLTWSGYGTTIPLGYQGTNANFQAALDTIFGAGNTSVTGPGSGPWTIEFIETLALTDIPTPTVDVSSLTIPVSITITTTQEAITQATALDSSGDSIEIGAETYEGTPNYWFTGDIYEARYSLIERSPSWIKFEAKNLLNGETTFAALESSGGSTLTLFPQKRILICA